MGETDDYCYNHIQTAMNLVNKGARLIATNTDLTGPIEGGIAPACRAFVMPIEATTSKKAYYIGKPNPLMMRTGLQMLNVHSSEAVMIGDRMDTDIVAGIETGLDTVLVLSGVTTKESVKAFPYRPRLILNKAFVPCVCKPEALVLPFHLRDRFQNMRRRLRNLNHQDV